VSAGEAVIRFESRDVSWQADEERREQLSAMPAAIQLAESGSGHSRVDGSSWIDGQQAGHAGLCVCGSTCSSCCS